MFLILRRNTALGFKVWARPMPENSRQSRFSSDQTYLVALLDTNIGIPDWVQEVRRRLQVLSR